MLILLSPAKTLNEEPESTCLCTSIRFDEKTQHLAKALAKLSTKAIASLMDLSDKLADLNRQRFQDLSKGQKAAILLYSGDVYRNMTVREWSIPQAEFAQSHLRILSGLYGLLRPYDLIAPHRLEMGTSLKVQRKPNLYKFWGDSITRLLCEDLSLGNHGLVLNLASIEYAQVLHRKLIPKPVIDVEFKEWRNDKPVTIALNSKRARGQLADLIIRNEITSLETVKNLQFNGYTLHSHTDNKLTFCKTSDI